MSSSEEIFKFSEDFDIHGLKIDFYKYCICSECHRILYRERFKKSGIISSQCHECQKKKARAYQKNYKKDIDYYLRCEIDQLIDNDNDDI
jgi:hypothetical protein